MATGLKIYNDANTIQIDENYFNLVLIGKYSGTVSMPSGPGYAEWTVPGEVVCIAVQVWPETFMVSGSLVSGGAWTFRVNFYNNPQTTGTCNFTFYAFGKCPPPTETVGLKVLNASGAVVFHSQFKPMRVLTFLSGGTGYTAPPGRQIAVMQAENSIFTSSLGVEANTWRCNGTSVETLITSVIAGAPLGTSRSGIYAAIDVTNY